MGEKTRFSKLMKWIKDTQDDVHFIHKGTVLSKDHPTSSRRPETRCELGPSFGVPSFRAHSGLSSFRSEPQLSGQKSVKMSLGVEYKISC